MSTLQLGILQPKPTHTEPPGEITEPSTSRPFLLDSADDVDFAPLRMLHLELADLKVASKRPISSGAFGKVWLGMYGNLPVAIKRSDDKTLKGIEKLAAEILL
ncbi:hypothetical protein ACHHYP_14441 [Achlya hypogyna]|uniref:Protein kinase domain-containing protein n=1 Tax=Achlya hypogyna TaxID=1202772 RepID=A0A1V9ZFH2_ACHHY|nr:hypothetical protein ACHHYP_14441 [Achlya hypogyna]